MQILETGNDHYNPRFSNGSMMCLFPPMPYAASPRRTFYYDSLHPPPLCLTVLKMDGSSFGVEVSKMGTVGELKQAVEAAFDYLPKEGPGSVAWEHVWGQFCLCHEGEMLLNDGDHLSMLGIKDGDQVDIALHLLHNNHQLQFTHCASSTNNFTRIKSKGADTSEDDKPHKDEGHKNSEDGIHEEENIEDNQGVHWDIEDDEAVSQRKHRLSLFSKGWFPYRKFSSSGSRLRLGERGGGGFSLRSPRKVLVGFKSCLSFSGHKYEPRRLTWKIK